VIDFSSPTWRSEMVAPTTVPIGGDGLGLPNLKLLGGSYH
jgi:hypothetical protein